MPRIDTSPSINDEIRQTTCYMCACRCGINVHMQSGEVRYIEGNRDHPVNKGVLCAKGSAGIMQHLSPARLRAPLKRVGERGKGEFVEISWEEALTTASEWLGAVRAQDPKKLAFFTGRDQSQALTGWWAQQFGTPNFAAHGGFCSVNMAAAGIYTLGGAFWEFGSPDWERCRLFLLFGVAEDHDSNPIKIGLGKLKERGARVIVINPIQSGYGAVADDWLGITPGTDGLLLDALIHCLLQQGKVDLDYLIRYSNAPWLVVQNPGATNDGMFWRDAQGRPQVLQRGSGKVVPAAGRQAQPELGGSVDIPEGGKAVPVFQLLAEQWLDASNAPEAVAERVGISAERIRALAAELAHTAFEQAIRVEQDWVDVHGEHHDHFVGRPVAMHAMRGISAHANGFQTCRSLHILQLLLGSVDVPGGFRFKPPYPKPPAAHPRPCGKPEQVASNQPLPGIPLGYPLSPQDLLVDSKGQPQRIDKGFSWEAPLSVHGMMHMVIANAANADPYPIDVLFMYMANMAWNSSMNSKEVMAMLSARDPVSGDYKIPKIIYSDAYSSEMVAFADLILPDTTYLERHDCISLLDRPISEPDSVADAIRWPVAPPERAVRGFQSVLLDLGARLQLPGMVNADGSAKYKDYADYIVNHERKPGIGPLAGFRGANGEAAGRGAVNPEQLNSYIANGGFWHHDIPESAAYCKQANQHYQDFAVAMGFFDSPQPVTFQIYSEELQSFRLAAQGHGAVQPPEHLCARILEHFTPLPKWYPPFEGAALDEQQYPLHALTQRPMAMYHSWGSQNPWLRQIHGHNPLYISEDIAAEANLADGDWAELSSHHSSIRVPVAVMRGLNPKTVWTWNAIGKRKGAWQLASDAPEATKGFLLNHLIKELLPARGDGLRWANSDPITGQAAWYDLRVRITRASDQTAAHSLPQFPTQLAPANLPPSPPTIKHQVS